MEQLRNLKKTSSSRVQQLGASIFARLAASKSHRIASGKRTIDLSIGSPDLPPTAKLIDEMASALHNEDAFTYPSSKGTSYFRETAAKWMFARFGVEVDADQELISLIGTQDGLAHISLAIGDSGDIALVPDPGYPIHHAGPMLAGMEVYRMPLHAANGYLPDLDAIPTDIIEKTVMLLLSYPSNPTTAVATVDDMAKWVDFCRAHGILLIHDLAYSEMAFDGFDPPSVLSIPGAKEIAIEFHSLSKSFNLAGSRIGFVVGQRDVISSLRSLKENIDYGVFHAVQQTGVVALETDIERILQKKSPIAASIYKPRRDLLIHILREMGWNIEMPRATMFVWAPIPVGIDSETFAERLLSSTGVVVVPGRAFGEHGEGFVRIALVQAVEVIREAAQLMGQFWQEEGWKNK